jgi:hypothetical protein
LLVVAEVEHVGELVPLENSVTQFDVRFCATSVGLSEAD